MPDTRDTSRPVRIANCSGFFGDRFSAAREMIEGGPIDVLTGDYLAELTMLILWHPRRGPARAMRRVPAQIETLGACVERGIKVVTDAGGLNPAGLAARCALAGGQARPAVVVAHIEGDDIIGRIDELLAAGRRSPTSTPAAPGVGSRAADGQRLPRRLRDRQALRGGADIVVARPCHRRLARHRPAAL